MQKTECFITSVCRALYARPDMAPKITIDQARKIFIEVTIDDDLSPGILIGSRASMRFALQAVIGAAFNEEPEQIAISVRGATGRQRQPDIDGQPPLTAPIQQLVDATCDLVGGSGETEAAASSVMAVIKVPESVKEAVRPSLLRIVRAAGKAHGFPAMAHITSEEVRA
jgi:hypothetical protein